MNCSVFVVDDEPKARLNLVDALSQYSIWRNITTFSSGKTLIEAVIAQRPNVVFLDIQMPGDNGLILAKQIQSLESPPLIVFVTAFSNYAVMAFELYALDFLLKPFDDSRVDMCVKRLKKVLSSKKSIENSLSAQDAWANNKPIDKIVVRSSSALRIIPIDNVYWVAANGNYVDIHHQEGKHLLRGSLKAIFKSLSSEDFVQIHRGYLVRRTLIRELKSTCDEKYSLILATGDVLPVGNGFRNALIDAMMAK